jgi:hypothetical protein
MYVIHANCGQYSKIQAGIGNSLQLRNSFQGDTLLWPFIHALKRIIISPFIHPLHSIWMVSNFP